MSVHGKEELILTANKTLAEIPSHRKQSESASVKLLHEATIKLQKSSIFNFHKMSKFSAIPARS